VVSVAIKPLEPRAVNNMQGFYIAFYKWFTVHLANIDDAAAASAVILHVHSVVCICTRYVV
jgi:hypothetical protein